MEVAKPHKPRRAWVAPVAVAAVAVAGAVFGLTREAPTPNTPFTPGPSCATATDRLIGVWDPDTRARVDAKFAAHRSEVDEVWRALAGDLDRYAVQWSERWTAACKAEHAVQLTCLENAVIALGNVVRSAADSDVVTYARAYKGTNLPDLARCN
jgi:hypothetical protein